MKQSHRITICVVTDGVSSASFAQCLKSITAYTPMDRVELRLGFSGNARPFHYALGVLCPDQRTPERFALPQGVARFRWTGAAGLPILAWMRKEDSTRDAMWRLLFHDVVLETEFVVVLDADTVMVSGWWDELLSVLDTGVAFVGSPRWHTYSQLQQERIQSFPWYLGVPFDRRDGHAGVSYMDPGFFVVKADGLRQANFPDLSASRNAEPGSLCGSEVLLGEIARQLDWTQTTRAVGHE